MDFQGKGKDILLTGASGAIGGAVARHLAAEGYRLHLTSREPKKLESLQKELSGQTEILTYKLDLLNLPACEETVQVFFKKAAVPYGLICNAGNLGVLGPFLDVDFKEWNRSIVENFLAQMIMIRTFGRLLRDKKGDGGRIVVLSGAGLGGAVAHGNLTSYGAAKAALTYLAESLAVEFKELRLNINAIAPGQVYSHLTDQAIQAGVERAGDYAIAAQKCKESGGVSPDLAARLVQFLMSSQAQGITGRFLSARFDQETLRNNPAAVEGDPHLYRLRRIDKELFAPV